MTDTPAPTHQGSCHCGAVTYEVDTALDGLMECNCSHCYRKGFVLAFAPRAAFRLKSGEADLTEYRFNRHRIAHQFCKTCGVTSYAEGKKPDGTAMRAVNARCLDGFDLSGVEIVQVDGRSF